MIMSELGCLSRLIVLLTLFEFFRFEVNFVKSFISMTLTNLIIQLEFQKHKTRPMFISKTYAASQIRSVYAIGIDVMFLDFLGNVSLRQWKRQWINQRRNFTGDWEASRKFQRHPIRLRLICMLFPSSQKLFHRGLRKSLAKCTVKKN